MPVQILAIIPARGGSKSIPRKNIRPLAGLPLLAAIVISWGIAFFEYLLQVPANRVGYGYFSAAELKAIQEIISLSVFAFFSTLYLGESLRWNHLVGFSLIVLAAFFIFKKW